jgi:RNA polymerase sigma factor (sigma-70 family)
MLAIWKLERGWTPDKGGLRPYIEQNAYRDTIDLFRSKSRRKINQDAFFELPEEIRVSPVDQTEVLALRDAIEYLDSDHRAVIDGILAGKTQKEIAEELEYSESWVALTMKAALGVLRSILTKGE